jgi:hypothetical protein
MKSCFSLPGDDSPRNRFLAMLPQIKKVLSFAFRELSKEARREATQDCIAAAWAAYRRLVERGRESIAYPTPLASYAVKQFWSGRRFSGQSVRDVTSPMCQQARGVKVERLPEESNRRQNPRGGWESLTLTDRHATPADLAAFRLDFAAWLRRLPFKVRKVAKRLALGERTQDAAKRFQVSSARISQLRRELEADWKAFQPEAV